MRAPSISVLLPAYREPLAYVKAAVISVQKQTFKDFECIIILDDPSNTQLQKFFRTVCSKDKRFKLLVNKTNVGLAATLNAGIHRSSGKYIARHDADDICLPNRFAKQIQFMKEHPLIDLLFTGVDYIDENGKKIGSFVPNPQHAKDIQVHIFDDVLLVHPTLFARGSVLRKNLYDPLFRRSQDTELWLRLIGSTRFAVLPEVCLLYRYGS